MLLNFYVIQKSEFRHDKYWKYTKTSAFFSPSTLASFILSEFMYYWSTSMRLPMMNQDP